MFSFPVPHATVKLSYLCTLLKSSSEDMLIDFFREMKGDRETSM